MSVHRCDRRLTAHARGKRIFVLSALCRSGTAGWRTAIRPPDGPGRATRRAPGRETGRETGRRELGI